MVDGTALWIVDDVRDGLQVGGLECSYILRAGRIKANGALLQRSDYPRLTQFIIDNPNISTTEADWVQSYNKHQFTRGDGSTTIRVPDLRGKWLQMADSVGALAAGLPNITGNAGITISSGGTGVFADGVYITQVPGGNGTSGWSIVFNASRGNSIYGNSDTVQPPSTKLIAQIKY